MIATLDQRSELLADRCRGAEEDGRTFSIRRTAATLGLTVCGADLGRFVHAAVQRDHVVINSALRPSAHRIRFLFAHEVAHVLIERGEMPWVAVRDQEWAADWFARELVLPKRLLYQADEQDQLQLFNLADPETVALQLAAVCRTPSVFRIGDRILCSRCGEEPHFYRCPCRDFRSDPVAAAELPVFLTELRVAPDQLALFEADEMIRALLR